MPPVPFSFFLDRPGTPVTPAQGLWQKPLPAGFQGGFANRLDPPVTYGEYFSQAQAFLADRHCRRLGTALKAGGRPMSGAIDAVAINLVKHGAFYHPARIDIKCGAKRLHLALNVAASPQGLALIDREVRNLRMLAKRFGTPFLPQAYLRGRAGRLSMFLARWFDGFHEFHWSRDPDSRRLALVLWDPQQGALPLSDAQVGDLFRRTALVMTWFFDLATLGHIGAWHHGAGDFVARPVDGRRVAVRLITVRRYDPLIKAGTAHFLIPALLLFLVKLSLQNRMDRRDGVHETLLAPETVVAATVEGFFMGLARKARTGVISPGAGRRLIQQLGRTGGADIADLVGAVAAVLEPGACEPLWDGKARRGHAGALVAALRAFAPA